MVASFLEALISTIISEITDTVKQEFLSPMLLWATNARMSQSCRLLLNKGAQPALQVKATSPKCWLEKHGSPLIAACAMKDLDLCTIFINSSESKSEDISNPCASGQYTNAFMAACIPRAVPREEFGDRNLETEDKSQKAIKQILREHWMDIDAALIAACATGDIELCQDLLKNGANPNATYSIGWCRTPLIAAASYVRMMQQNEYWELEDKIYLEYRKGGPNLNVRHFEHWQQWELQAKSWQIDHPSDRALRLDMCKLLEKHGANINAVVSSNGSHYIGTALIGACVRDDADLCRYLIAHGANPELYTGGIFPTATAAARAARDRIKEPYNLFQVRENSANLRWQIQNPGRPLYPRKGGAIIVLEESLKEEVYKSLSRLYTI